MQNKVLFLCWAFFGLCVLVSFNGIKIDICVKGEPEEAIRVIHELEGNGNHCPVSVEIRSR